MSIRKNVLTTLLALAVFVPTVNAESLPEHVVALRPVDVKQIQCLADNVYHEARGEPDDGKLGVALVTMNRTEAPGFPSTVCEVVYEKTRGACQFSWVCKRGMIPDRNSALYQRILDLAEFTYLNYDKSMVDITKSSLYFHATHSNPGWNLRKTIEIGRHIFYRKKEPNVQKRGEGSGG